MRDSGEGDDGKVWGDLCREKRVNIAYKNDPTVFEVDDETGGMVMYPVKPVSGFTSSISWQWEIFYTFFKNYNIVPNWMNCHGVTGYYADYSDYLEYLYASFLSPTNSGSLMDSKNNTMAPKDYYDYYESLSTSTHNESQMQSAASLYDYYEALSIHNESQMHSAASLYDYYESLPTHNESQMQSASDTLSLYDYYDFYDYFDTHDDPKPSTACTTGIDGKVSYTFLPDCPKTVLLLCAL